jgi:hypothetical protein
MEQEEIVKAFLHSKIKKPQKPKILMKATRDYN